MKNLIKKNNLSFPTGLGISKAKKGFTLVELIVVIAIVAILAVSAGMMLTKWIGKAGDTKVIADLNTIEKAMEVQYVYNGNYPIPDTPEDVTGTSGEYLWKQGTFGETVVSSIDELDKVPTDETKDDPKKGYDYSVTEDQEKYEVYGKLSDDSYISYNPYFNETIAEDGEKYITSVGNYNGYVIGTTGGNYYMYETPSMYVLTGERTLLTGATRYLYNIGERLTNIMESGKQIQNVEITQLVNDPTDTTTLQTITDSFEGVEDITQAGLAVNKAGGESVKVEVSTTSSEGTSTSGPATIAENTCENGLCVFNLSGSDKTATDKKLMTYQPANVDLSNGGHSHGDNVPSLEWGCYGTDLNGEGGLPDDNENGSGNTQTIVDQNCTIEGGGDSGADYIAADYCDALEITVDGYKYDDWYLPARYELDAMCAANSNGAAWCDSGDLAIGGYLGVENLRSSTEAAGGENALNRPDWDAGGLRQAPKLNEYAVQCVRAPE